VREADDLPMKFGGNRNWAEPFESVDQGMGEAVESVSVLDDAFPLNVVENFADLLGRKLVVIQEFDETGNGALEVNVVLPERVVGVDE
jgi:hypothetical protein